MSPTGIRTAALMGTVIAIEVIGCGSNDSEDREREDAIGRAIAWFRRIEQTCSRFDSRSELRRLSLRVGEPVPVSGILYEVVQFALAVAQETNGAFDLTVGHRMEVRGFNRNYRTGREANTPLEVDGAVSFRDIRLDPTHRTISLARPLVLDLGAVAKGLAIDLAARELRPFKNFAINAGGDLYLSGHSVHDRPWSIGIRHPRAVQELIDTVRVSDLAVCTSGDYERRSRGSGEGHHIIDPRTGGSAAASASVTVIAKSAMVADALATAAFVLGPEEGRKLLKRHGVEGLIVTPALERFATPGLCHG
jgi:FAD:protein FMN transferase